MRNTATNLLVDKSEEQKDVASTNPPVGSVSLPVNSRSLGLDIWRGFFLVLMTVDHLPTFLRSVSYQFAGYVSAAEGFVFLSGFVAGLVYLRACARGTSEGMIWRRAIVRSGQIYGCYFFAFVSLAIIFHWIKCDGVFADSWKPLLNERLPTILLMGVTFLYQPLGLDILPFYCLAVLTIPVVVFQLRKGATSLVLGVSASLWLLAQFHFRAKLLTLFAPKVPIDFGSFNFFAWQLLFVVGVYCGFQAWKRGKVGLDLPIYWKPVIIIAVILLFFARHCFTDIYDGTDPFTDKDTLGIVRVVNFFALYLLAAGAHGGAKFLCRAGFLAYLGRNSLPVFTFQIFLTYFANSIFHDINKSGIINQTLLLTVCVLSLFLPAFVAERLRRRG